jgi:uncharacterized protein
MNQEERNLLQGLFDRLRDSSNQARDPEAERFIAEQIRFQPGAPYYMSQAVIVQEQALQDSQARIAELEARVHELESVSQPRGQGGFLAGRTGGMFSRGVPAPQSVSSPASAVPAIGPWGRTSAAPAPQQQGYSQPMQAQPMQAQQPVASGGGGGFLKGALATAAGVAGGALIYDQMKGMFGGNQQAQANTPSADQAAADQYQDEGQDAQPVDNDDQDFGGGDSGGGDLDI